MWDAISFPQVYDFAPSVEINESWQQKNQNQINVANSYWIAGDIRSFRRQFDEVVVYDPGNEVGLEGGSVDVQAGQYATVPRYNIDGRPIYPYGLIIGADAGLSFDFGSEYVGQWTLINALADPYEPMRKDSMTRYVPPAESTENGSQNVEKINFLPKRPDGADTKVTTEYIPDGTQGAFDEVWGGWEYYNHSYGIECAYDCFHTPRNDHYHKIEELVVPIARTNFDKGERTFFHEYEYYYHFRSFSADGRPRAYNRAAFDEPVQVPPYRGVGYGNPPVQYSENKLSFISGHTAGRRRTWGSPNS